jgi:hypothetical protein
MTVKEVSTPPNRYCHSGHEAPEWWHRGGTKAPLERTKFFQVSCDSNPSVDGVYCEPCLVIANAIAGQQKKEIK